MTEKEDHIKDVLQEKTKGINIDISITRNRRVFVKIEKDDLKKIAEILAEDLGTQHLSTITARDTGTNLELLYHFFIDGVVVTVRTTCTRADPTVDSLVRIFPGAILYEREIHDILGIVPKKHPDLRRLVLPEDWSGGYPLRKDWKPEGGDGNGSS